MSAKLLRPIATALTTRSTLDRSATTSQTDNRFWLVARSPSGSAGTSPLSSHGAASDLYQRFSRTVRRSRGMRRIQLLNDLVYQPPEFCNLLRVPGFYKERSCPRIV